MDNGDQLITTLNPDSTVASQSDSSVSVVISYTYDHNLRVTQQKTTLTGTNSLASTLNYTYDNNGNLLTLSDGTNTTTYTYDAANRNTSIKEQGGTCPGVKRCPPRIQVVCWLLTTTTTSRLSEPSLEALL